MEMGEVTVRGGEEDVKYLLNTQWSGQVTAVPLA
jgi:hypothetical protein